MKFVKSIGFSVLGLACFCGIACDNPNDVKQKAEMARAKGMEDAKKGMEKGMEALKKGAEKVEHLGEEALAKAKEEYAKMSGTHLEVIEQKIKDLAGEKAAEAQALFEKAKEKVIKMKDAAPDKFHEMKAEAEKLIAELKEKVGL